MPLMKSCRTVSRQQTANQRTPSKTIGHKESPLGKVRSKSNLIIPIMADCCRESALQINPPYSVISVFI